MIFDTHAHYDDVAFDEDREEVLARFEEFGIEAVTDPGSTLESLDRIITLAGTHANIYGALGIHPSECGEMTEKDLEKIRQGFRLPKMVAVGEIGLDYHWDTPEREVQKHWFRRQLDLAREEKKPVIIHSRDAAADTLQILREGRAEETGGVIHCYSYSAEMAPEFLRLGFFLGVGGVVTFRNGKKLKETVRQTPLERIVLETDSPYMAPEPHRGERNSSLFLRYVVRQIAEIKELPAETVMEQTWKNACRLYRIDRCGGQLESGTGVDASARYQYRYGNAAKGTAGRKSDE